MIVQLEYFIIVFFVTIVFILGKEDELPLCPTNINYLPQPLPMHCRMPRSISFPTFPGGLPNYTFPPLPPGYPSPGKAGPPMPFPMPPGMEMGGPPGLPGPPGMPAPPPMPMHVPMMPMPPPGPAHKVPVIVMPFYSPEGVKKPSSGRSKHKGGKKRKIRINKKRLPHYQSESRSDTDTGTSETDDSRYTSGDTSSSETDGGWWGGRRKAGRSGGRKRMNQRRRHKGKGDFLTPIIQYITKDGYVIFEKKISKDQANDWLQDKKEFNERGINEPPKEENEWKNEEDDVLREYVIGTTETTKRRITGTKIYDELDKIKIKVHKNRRRPHTPSHNES